MSESSKQEFNIPSRLELYKTMDRDHLASFAVLLEMILEQTIIEKERQKEQLERDSLYDTLTGIYNRRGLETMYDKLRSNNHRRATDVPKPNAILVCDSDKLKQINDLFGHQAGDELIQHTVHLFTSRLRENDIIGRLGGDEFLALLPETNMTEALAIAKQIQQKTSALAIGDVRPTLSIGIAEMNPELEFGEMFSKADEAMYVAKRNGGNTIAYITDNKAVLAD